MNKNPKYPTTTIALLAKKMEGSLVGQDYVDWAVQALTEDFDSPSLAILASLDISNVVLLWEAEQFFQKVIFELGWSIPDKDTILRTHFITFVHNIQNGTIDPEIGIDRIHREVISPLEHPSDLQGWCLLWEGNAPIGYGPIPKEKY